MRTVCLVPQFYQKVHGPGLRSKSFEWHAISLQLVSRENYIDLKAKECPAQSGCKEHSKCHGTVCHAYQDREHRQEDSPLINAVFASNCKGLAINQPAMNLVAVSWRAFA